MIELTMSSPRIKPLTKRKKETNELYFRRSEVESQIGEIISLEKQRIFALLENREREREGYLFDETICYLLRERREDVLLFETLYLELNRRIWKLLRKFHTYFPVAADFEDFGQKVEMEIIKKIIISETNAGDYAQINFGDYVVSAAASIWKRKLIFAKRENELFDRERAADDETAEKSDENRFAAKEISVEAKMILKARLAELPENIRTAAVLHYLDGWQIESTDKNQPTVSKYFGKSSRQIRNWLTQAREILSRQEGDKNNERD